MIEDPLERIDYIHRSKIVRRIAWLKEEKKKKHSTHTWTEDELYDQLIGELVDLIT